MLWVMTSQRYLKPNFRASGYWQNPVSLCVWLQAWNDFLCSCFMRNISVYLYLAVTACLELVILTNAFPLSLKRGSYCYWNDLHTLTSDDSQHSVTRGRTQSQQLWISFILIGSHLLLTHLRFSENFTGMSLFYWTLEESIGQMLCSSDLRDIKDLSRLTLESVADEEHLLLFSAFCGLKHTDWKERWRFPGKLNNCFSSLHLMWFIVNVNDKEYKE